MQPSVQKLIPTVHHEIIRHCNDEESWRDHSSLEANTRLYAVLDSLRSVFLDKQTNISLMHTLKAIAIRRNEEKERAYGRLASHLLLNDYQM